MGILSLLHEGGSNHTEEEYKQAVRRESEESETATQVTAERDP
jgi:hypothetical protein